MFDATIRSQVAEVTRAREARRQKEITSQKARAAQEKAAAEAALLQKQTEAYNQAYAFFSNRRYEEASALLGPVLTSTDTTLLAKATRLKAAADLRSQITRDLPLSEIVRVNSVAIADPSRVIVNKGVLESLTIATVSDDPGCLALCRSIHLHNPTPDKVKPDVQILVLNRDGVILFKHSENWLVNTLDYGDNRTIQVNGPVRFPHSLVFSKWASIAWDVQPFYALCVGSKSSYDGLRTDLLDELRRVRANPPVSFSFHYDAKEVLPEIQPFSFRTKIPISNSQIVESLTFSQKEVNINYFNRSDMRIKPNIMGYVLNQDGVIIGSFADSWALTSLSPAERQSNTVAISFAVPDELVFSRWAAVAYDEKPAWVLVAGSSKQFAELVERTEARIRKLNSRLVLAE